jgi:hypothetical protein
MAQRKLQGRRHAVRFYGDDQSLFKTVGGFLSEGLVAGEPAIVIATGSHQQGIVEELGARLIDVERARRLGDIVLLDADETLALFMTPDGPNEDLFERYVGRVIDQTVRGHRQSTVRAYGEMVDILWHEGEIEAALQVEILWNRLATTYAFSLLCGYAMGHFHEQVELMERVCACHTDVVDPESNVLPFTPRSRA